MLLKDLWVGKIEGKDAFFEDKNGDDSRFDTFLIPENVSVTRLLTHQSYFVLGLRGTGKTSFLRYVANSIRHERFSHFVLFKTDITEYKRSELSRNVWFDEINSSTFEISQDFKESWNWFIYHQIVLALVESGSIERNSSLSDITGVGRKWYNTVLGYFPKLKGGSVSVSGDVGFLETEIELEFSPDKKQLKFDSLNRAIESKICRSDIKRPLLIIFDELEVFLNQKSNTNGTFDWLEILYLR